MTKWTPEMGRLADQVDDARIWRDIEAFARIGGDGQGGVSRIAFSQEDVAARKLIRGILAGELGLKVRVDPIGNIIARREGLADGPVIMTGSHLDTVKNGGRFDGMAGVLCAVEAFRALDQAGARTRHPLELTVFTSEEPNTFGMSTLGSRVMAGKVRREDLVALRDADGRDFRDALAAIGGDLDHLEAAARRPGEIDYFIEVHIEQMPTLDERGADLAIVSGIGGIHRERISVRGEPRHSGTTTMDRRRDALCAAAALILELEQAARHEPAPSVATVGRMSLAPNAVGIIPGLVEIEAEIRSPSREVIQRIVRRLEDSIAAVAEARRVEVARRVTYRTTPVDFSTDVREAAGTAAASLGLEALELFSMAGHDAAHVSGIAPSGMIFLPSRGGLSHCPGEYTDQRSLGLGARCLLGTLALLDQGTNAA